MSYINGIGGGFRVENYTLTLRKSSRTVYKNYRINPYDNVQSMYIAPFYDLGFLTVRCQVDMAIGDMTLKWRVRGTNSLQGNSLVFPIDTPQLTISIVAVQGYNELFDINYDEGDWSWRTDLFTGSTKSTLNVTYDEANAYEVYVNGELLGTISQPKISNIYFDNIITTPYTQQTDSSITTDYYTETTPQDNYILGFFPFPEGSYRATFEKSGLPTIYCNWNCVFKPSRIKFTSNDSLFGSSNNYPHITFPTQDTLYYKYVVDNPELINAQFETLEGVSWTGLESPYFYFMNSGDMKIQFPNVSGQNIQVSCSTTNRYSFNPNTGSAEYRFGNDKAIPGAIGMVSVKTVTHHQDPQDIYTDTKTNGVNDYNVKSTKDWNGLEYKDNDGDIRFEPDKCTNEINNILKIQLTPPISSQGFGVNMFSVQEKEICDNNNWQYVDCDLISGGYIYAQSTGAYVYKDFYRPRYQEENDPNNVLHNTNYRQRHWSHLRYMKHEFKKVVETEVEGQTVETEEPYNPPIDLIYKPFGRYCSGHTWTATYDNVMNCYDLITCNGGGVANTDECLSKIKPEDYKLYKEHAEEDDPEGEITYLNEVPQLHIGYLPNVVGRIKIPIPQGVKIKLSSIQSVLSPNPNMQELTLKWDATNTVTDFDYSSDDISDWTNYHNLVEGYETTYSAVEKSETYRILTTLFTLNTATVTIAETGVTQVIDLTTDWQDTLSTSKSNGFTIDMWFTEISTGYVIHASQYIAGSNNPDCQDYFRFRLKTSGQTIGVECEEATWWVGDVEYTLNEWHRLQIIQGQYYSKEIPRHEITFQCGTEFKPMEYVGEHNPTPEEEGTTDSWDTYLGRYVAVAVNGARCGDIPEIVRSRAPHSQTSNTLNLKLREGAYCSGNPDNPCNQCPVIFPRDDIGEFKFNTKTYPVDGDGNYPISTIYDGQDARVHYLDCWNTVINGEWKQMVVTVPEVDKIISSSWMTRTLKIGLPLTNSQGETEVMDYITVKGSFGGMYNGATNKLLPNAPTGAVKEQSPMLDTHAETDGELPIDYIDMYGSYRDTRELEQNSWLFGKRWCLNDRKHATRKKTYDQTIPGDWWTEWRLNNNHRIIEFTDLNYETINAVVDGMKYTLSYVFVRGGKILRNLAGKILRNSQGKILRGDDM